MFYLPARCPILAVSPVYLTCLAQLKLGFCKITSQSHFCLLLPIWLGQLEMLLGPLYITRDVHFHICYQGKQEARFTQIKQDSRPNLGCQNCCRTGRLIESLDHQERWSKLCRVLALHVIKIGGPLLAHVESTTPRQKWATNALDRQDKQVSHNGRPG